MTINRLLACEPAYTSSEIYTLADVLDVGGLDLFSEQVEGVKLHYYIDVCFDGERGLELFTVSYRDQVCAVCQRGGRGGRDAQACYVVNNGVYKSMLIELFSAYLRREAGDSECVDRNTDLPTLERFYGCKLVDYFDPNLKPKFREGDIVMARVPFNHLDPSSPEIWTRCKIHKVSRFNPTETYYMNQLDRRWARGKEMLPGDLGWKVIVTELDGGAFGAAGNDSTVVAMPDMDTCGKWWQGAMALEKAQKEGIKQ